MYWFRQHKKKDLFTDTKIKFNIVSHESDSNRRNFFLNVSEFIITMVICDICINLVYNVNNNVNNLLINTTTQRNRIYKVNKNRVGKKCDKATPGGYDIKHPLTNFYIGTSKRKHLILY